VRLVIDTQGLRKMTEDAIKRLEEEKYTEWRIIAEDVIKAIPAKCATAAHKGRSSVTVMKYIDKFVKRKWWVGKRTFSGPLLEVVTACNEAGLRVQVEAVEDDYRDWVKVLVARW